MARKDSRKLFLFGRYSLALLLPKNWLRELGAERGDVIAMKLDRKRQRLVLRFGTELASTELDNKSAPKANLPETKIVKEATDFQPIPEL